MVGNDGQMSSLLESLRFPDIKLPPQLTIPIALFDSARSLASMTTEIANAIQQSFAPYVAIFADLAITKRRCDILESAGWLPHYTTPFDILEDEAGTPSEIATRIEHHYTDQWSMVRKRFEETIRTYKIDGAARDIFFQALVAHESGLYPLVARGLFPEVERLTRQKLYDGQVATVTDPQKLKKFAGELPLSAFDLGGLMGLQLYKKLIDHLYNHVTKASLEEIGSDPVPNRHAAIHGYESYNSVRSSINALIMTDYIFQILSSVPLSAPTDTIDQS